MSKTVAPAPLTDASYWRRLLARCHPDAGGDHELFLFAQTAREAVEGGRPPGRCVCARGRGGTTTEADRTGADRVPFEAGLGEPMRFVDLTCRAIRWGRDAGEPYKRVTDLLSDCPTSDHGRAELRQRRGATYKQAGYIAHLAGFSEEERRRWYELCRAIPLSERHAAHLIDRLRERSTNHHERGASNGS